MQKSNYLLLIVLPLLLGSFKTVEPVGKKDNNTLSFSIYLQLDGIQGDARDAIHTNWIDVKSYSFGATNSRVINGGFALAGRANGSDLNINAVILDKSLIPLLNASLVGDNIAEGKLEIIEVIAPTRSNDFAERVTLTNILVTSVNVTGVDSRNGTVDVSFTLNFQKIKRELKDRQNNGTYSTAAEMTWDYSTNSTF